MKMITYKELSTPLKIAIIGIYAILALYTIAFIIGIIGATKT